MNALSASLRSLTALMSLGTALALGACAAPAADDAGSGGQAVNDSEAEGGLDALLAGDWSHSDASIASTLKIRSVSPFRFDLTAVRKTGGGNFGDISEGRATVSKGVATYVAGNDCTITFTPKADKLELVQVGACSEEAGFGAFVDVSGSYVRATPAPPPATFAAELGEYSFEDDSISGTLKLTSVAPPRFDLFVIRKSGGGNFGDLQGASAADVGGTAEYRNGDDCTIRLTPKGGAIDLVQQGSCSEGAGFGAFVDGTGTYAKRAAK